MKILTTILLLSICLVGCKEYNQPMIPAKKDTIFPNSDSLYYIRQQAITQERMAKFQQHIDSLDKARDSILDVMVNQQVKKTMKEIRKIQQQ